MERRSGYNATRTFTNEMTPTHHSCGHCVNGSPATWPWRTTMKNLALALLAASFLAAPAESPYPEAWRTARLISPKLPGMSRKARF